MKLITKLPWLMFSVFFLSLSSLAQTTEDFETETIGSTTFTDNSQNFTITNGSGETNYDIETFASGGWNGTAPDNNFVDNSGSPFPALGNGTSFTISTSDGTDIYINKLYLFISQFNLTAASGFTLSIQGRKDGALEYNIIKTTGFSNTTTFSPNNGFTLIDFTTEGGSNNSNTAVDELIFTTSSNADYIALDGINWEFAPVCVEPTIPSVTATPNPICVGSSTTLTISGTLNDATEWHIYTGFCGITEVGTTTGSTFVVSPTSNTSYFVRGEGGCTTPGTCGAVNVTVNAAENASFSYSASAYCVNDTDPTPTITGVGGGNFVATTPGLSINGSTGSIDVSASIPGTYTIEYTTPGACSGTASVSVTINALDDASFAYSAASFCTNDADPTPTITGLAGGSFSSGAGLSINAGTGTIDVSASIPGAYTLTYTTAGTCPNSSNVSVTINALDNASFNYSAVSYCVNAGDPTPTITGLPGGSYSSGAGLSINAGTGTLDVSASIPGSYTITYTTTGTCPNSSNVSVTINALDDATFSYSAAAYCVNDADPTPTITGLPGGSFSGTAGLSINAGTGTLDVSASIPGIYTVTYTTAGSCPNSSNVSVTINALDDASFSYSAAAYCVNDTDPTPTVTGLPGGSFLSGAGLSINASSGVIDVSASIPGAYTITYTTAGTCPNSSNVSVTVNALDDASFFYSAFAHCVNASDPIPTVTGLGGGTFSSTAGLSINASTGVVDVSASIPGTYLITYTTAGTCPNSSAVTMAVNGLDDASFSYSAAAFCVNDTDPTPTISGLAGGTFSSVAGLSINALTGVLDVSASIPGAYTVTYTTAGQCPNSSNVSVTINALDDASFNYGAATYCIADTDPTPTISGLAGGTFSSGAGLSINGSTGAIDLSVSTPGIYIVTYTTTGTCPNSSNVSVTITSLDDASFNYSATAYCVNDTDPTATITGVTGGAFSSGAGLSINASTGAIDVSASIPGIYTVTYTTVGSCSNSSNVSVTINALDDATFSYGAAAYCADATDPSPTIAGLAGGTFSSGAGLSINASTGAIDVSASTPGSYTVTYTTAGTCPNSSSVSVTVNALDDATFSYGAATYCANETDPSATITGLAGGTFSSGAGLAINPSTGVIDLSTSTPGTYTVTYATTGTCPNSSSVSVTVNTVPTAPSVVTPLSACPGASVILSVTGSGTGNIVLYDNTMTEIGSVPMPPATATLNLGALADGVYTFFATEENGGCESTPVTINVTVGDAVAPTAVCQDITIFLDGVGSASIVAADIDGGSLDDCGAVTLSASQTTFDCSNIFGAPANNLVITGAYDAGLTGGTPKGVELYVLADIADLSQYGVGSANNGGGTDGEEFTFPAVSVTAGTYIYLASETVQFTNFFGFAPDYTDGAMSINGDDAVELFFGGNVIDVFGDINTDGSGEPWDFLDGWAYRNSGTGPDGTSFALGSWSFSGINVFDGQTSNATAPTPFPIGTYAYAAGPGPTPVTLTVTDGSGNTSTCIANVTVSDTISPLISCSSGIQNISDDGSGDCTFTPSVLGQAGSYSISDNCSSTLSVQEVFTGALTATSTWSLAPGTNYTPVQAFPVGVTNVTVTVTDESGNSASCSYTTTIMDDEAPAAVCQSINVYLDGAGNATIVAADIDGGSTDNCGTVTLSASTTAFTCADLGANNVVLTVTDENLNSDVCTAVVTVVDTISPVITCPGDQTEIASAICDFTLPDYSLLGSATDVCGGTPTITQSPAAGTVISSNTTITLTADDGNGNTSTCTFEVLLDVTACAGVECTNAIVLGPHDPCGDQTTVTGSTVGGTTSTETSFCGASAGSGGANWYTFTGDGGTWTASTVSGATNYDTKLWIYEGLCGSLNCVTGNDDFSGVQSQASFATTIGSTYYVVVGGYSANEGNYEMTLSNVEAIAPVPDAASLADVTGVCEVTSLTAPTATDNCSATVTVTNDATFPITTQGMSVVTWTFDDGNGNTATQTQNVILTDVTAPVADLATLADVTAECEVTSLTDPTATDDCGGTVTVTNDATLPISTQGTTIVTWTYEDENSNTSTQTQNIVITDATAPVPDAATLADVTGDCEVTVLIDPTAIDNCSGAITVTNDAIFPISTQGTTVVTWTFDDGNGNTSTQTQNVVIDDFSSPLPTVAPLADVTGECSVDVMPAAPVAIDACAGSITGVTTATFPITTPGVTVITWTFDDGNGNITTQSQNIIVDDVTAPAPDVATLADVTGDCSIDQPTAPTAMDNCSGAITATTSTVFPITAIGTTVIVWEFIDANGNVTTQTQNAINTGVDATATLSGDGATITANTAGATYAWVNCDFNTTIAGETGQSFTPPANGNYSVIVTVGNCSDTSACENVSTVGIDKLSADLLMVYPNPSLDGYFTVSYEGTIESIDVVDMLGRVIELPTDLSSGIVNGSELAHGRYMIRVRTEQSVVITEIVIAR
ncbi:MAG: hypothetical protein COA38_06940 [Fluviicola sp.]|nr:MAG: hypothetical protein COA38_06940 [Fluviicola sp.]